MSTEFKSAFQRISKEHGKKVSLKKVKRFIKEKKSEIKLSLKLDIGDREGTVWLKENAPMLLEMVENLNFSSSKLNEAYFYCVLEFLDHNENPIHKESLFRFFTSLTEVFRPSEEELREIVGIFPVVFLALVSKSASSDRRSCPQLFRLIHGFKRENFESYVYAFSPLEQILRYDPSGIYPKMTKESQRQYKTDLYREGKRSGKTAEQIAKEKLLVASETGQHIGFYLRKLKHHIFPIAPVFVLFFYLLADFALTFESIALTAFLAIPLYFFIRDLVDFILSLTVPCEVLPSVRVDEVDEKCKTSVVITALIQSENDVRDLCEKLHCYQINNAKESDQMFFGLLCDLKESDDKNTDLDQKLIQSLSEKIELLNHESPRFFAIVRSRRYCESERKWVGWERKRGAIEQFISYLCGHPFEDAVFIGACENTVGSKFLVTLDADTRLAAGQAKRLIGYAVHSLNEPVVQKVSGVWRVVRGHGILQPKISSSLLEKIKTPFGKMIGNGSGNVYYASASYDRMQYFHGEANFCGKGIINVKAYQRVINGRFPEQRILSHDMPEGALLRCGLLTNEYFSDSNPQNTKSYYQRQHRWIRGDVQNLIVFPLLSKVRKIYYLESLARYFVPISEFLLLVFASLYGPMIGFSCALIILLFHAENLFFTCTALFLSGNLETVGRRFATKSRNVIWNGLYCFVFSVSSLCFEAVYFFDAIIRSLYRMLVSKEKLLEWQVFSPVSGKGNSFSMHLPSLVLALSTALIVRKNVIIAFSLLWMLFPLLCLLLSKPYSDQRAWTPAEREYLRNLAEKEFLFFRRCVNQKTSFLPPDNVQTEPSKQIAMRTSPTNVGLYLASLVAALEMGMITENEFLISVGNAYSTIEKLERWRGHLFNWYDLNNLQVIGDRFVSTVDSGNYVACLMVVVSALKKMKNETAAELVGKLENDVHSTDFKALYRTDRNLFCVGVDTENNLKTDSDYDLYMSEQRITSYLGIALGQIPVSHWGSLKRPLAAHGGRVGVASWSGTAFEYFMPMLFLPLIENSMEDETLDFAYFCQHRYSARISNQTAVFGISESGFSLQDDEDRYQYKAFGVPYLAVNKGKSFPKVISPYSSFLLLERRDSKVIKNLKTLAQIDMVGDFGYYEAMEFHQDNKRSRTRISSYMSHHKGMSVLALANAVCDNVISKHFLSYGLLSFKLELLAERFPVEGKVSKTVRIIEKKEKNKVKISKKEFHLASVKTLGNLVSNGKTSMVFFNNGAMRVLWKKRDFFVPDSFGIKMSVKSTDFSFSLPNDEQKDFKLRFMRDRNECVFRDKGRSVCVSTELTDNQNGFSLNLALKGFPAGVRVCLSFDLALVHEKECLAHPAFQSLSLEGKKLENSLVIRKRGLDRHLYLHLFSDEEFFASTYNKSNESKFDYRPLLGPNVGITFDLDNANNRRIRLIFVPSEMERVPNPFEPSASKNQIPSSKRIGDIKVDGLLRSCFFDEECQFLEQIVLCKALGGRRYFLNPSQRLIGITRDWIWSFGISGDHPIVLINADLKTEDDEKLCKNALCVAKHVLLSGISIDFVFIQREKRDYFNAERDGLTDLIGACQCEFLIGKHPGIHVVSVTNEGAEKFSKIAVVVLNGTDESPILDESSQNFEICKSDEWTKNGKEVGKFLRNGFEINKRQYNPNESFSHVVSNRVCGFVCNQNSLGYTWYRNAGLNRISKWVNLPNENDGEKIYLNFDGVKYDLLQMAENVTFLRHVAVYEGNVRGEKYRITASLSEIVSSKIMQIELSYDLSMQSVLQFSFVPSFGASANGNVSLHAEEDFVVMSPIVTGEYRNGYFFWCNDKIDCLKRFGERIEIFVNACEKNTLLFGGYSGEKHLDFILKHARSISFDDLVDKEKETFERFFADEVSDLKFWIRYQTVHARFFGRTGLYQSSGAYGFRDQLQDSLAFLPFAPEICKMQILRCASHQFSEGDVQHWWHSVQTTNGTHPGIRSRCSDDYLWLLYGTAEYIDFTGDVGILDLKAPFISSEPLKTNADEAYFVPKRGEFASVRAHLQKCVELFLRRGLGKHGLPPIGSGDWNDGMNRLDGESVWLGFFGGICLKCTLPYLEPSLQEKVANFLNALVRALNESFNGCWFPRAYLTDGRVLGNDPSLESECSVDLITQAFAGFFAIDFPGFNAKHAKNAMVHAYEALVDHKNGIVKLFDKPFVKTNPAPGYIQRYVAGVRENGGQYTHAAVFFALSLLRFGKKFNDDSCIQKAIEISNLLDPSKKLEVSMYQKYRREPYVLCGDVYNAIGLKGHGGWSWYTGAAGWYHTLLNEIEKMDRNYNE